MLNIVGGLVPKKVLLSNLKEQVGTLITRMFDLNNSYHTHCEYLSHFLLLWNIAVVFNRQNDRIW